MAVHCHQPVGNFGFVFDEAFRKAYEPFIAALERHPGIRVGVHYSGPLLDWFEAHQPAFVQRLRTLADRRQIEFLAGGYYEPLLPLIPEADRRGQIALMRQTLARLFGVDATGLWLTERVWEPDLPSTLAASGIRYTMLDTNQFRVAQPWLPADRQIEDEFWDVLGCYNTDHAGRVVGVFPMSKRLRYWIPFQEPERTIEFLRRAARTQPVAVTYADDGEKFGLWPKTFEWVYEQGWLERFFSALERESSWIRTETFSDYLSRAGTDGQVYLPCGSYEEMLEWSRGFFRNFLVKYPESDAMYRKMLDVSRRVNARGPSADGAPDEATQALYRAQCNDAYWHGVFGGLYLANLRREIWRQLLAAERALEPSPAWPAVRREDLDGDGVADVIAKTSAVGIMIAPQHDGAVTEVAHYASGANLVDTLSRRYEPYHEKLKARQLTAAGRQAPTSIHDALRVKEQGLEAHLAYDDHRRVWFVDYGFSTMPTLQAITRSTWSEHRLWSWGPWVLEDAGVQAGKDAVTVTMRRPLGQGRAEKTISLDRRTSAIGCHLSLDGVTAPVVGLELNLGVQDDARRQPQWQEGVRELVVRDPHLKLAVTITLEPAGTVATFPIETVSDSEEGLERTMQGVAVVCLWPAGGSAWTGGVRCDIRPEGR
jgi:alpha-amylase